MRAFDAEKTRVDDIDRSVYDQKGTGKPSFQVQSGLTPAIVNTIADEKNDPPWMRAFRQKCLKLYGDIPLPG